MTDRICKVRFAYNSRIKTLESSSITSMDEVVLFEKENAVTDIRTKPWKPKGNFEVTAANNKIYINDGSDKTVTLDVGEYTYSTLAAHIETKLNASSSLWTCDYDFDNGTFLFTIAHTGSATLRFSQTSNAAWEMLGYVVSIDDTGTNWPADEQRNHTGEWIEFDLGTSLECSFFAAISDANDYFPISDQATIKLMADDIPNNWSAPALDLTLEITDTGIFRFFEDQPDIEFRYWRFYFEDKTNPVGPEGFPLKVWLSDYETFENANVNQGFQKAIVDPSESSQSTNGQKYFTRYTKYKTFTSAVIAYLSSADRSVLEQLFFNVGITTPWFIAFDPLSGVSIADDDLTCYVRFTRDLQMEHVFGPRFSVSIDLEEAL